MTAGFKWSVIDYARKIEELFAKMEGVRNVVLPPNREVVDGYFGYVWRAVHTLTAAALSQSSPQSSGLDDLKKFKPYRSLYERLACSYRDPGPIPPFAAPAMI